MKNRTLKLAGWLLLPFSGGAFAAWEHNLQQPVTRIAADIYELHMLMLGICFVVFVGVFGVMFYSIYKHRRSAGHQAEHFHENTTVEVVYGHAWRGRRTVTEDGRSIVRFQRGG